MNSSTTKKYIITERILNECIKAVRGEATLNVLNNIKDGKRPYRLDGVMNLQGFTPIKEEFNE